MHQLKVYIYKIEEKNFELTNKIIDAMMTVIGKKSNNNKNF